ncbi:hypothetical protein [Nostoc sp. WHI]|nr:hypothetical protein [Nostoc sp. WHI]
MSDCRGNLQGSVYPWCWRSDRRNPMMVDTIFKIAPCNMSLWYGYFSLVA